MTETETLGPLTNPYLQDQCPAFGDGPVLPPNIRAQYQTEVGNPVGALEGYLQYPPQTRLPATMTKAGAGLNSTPQPLPANMVNIKFPERSSSSHAIIEQPRVGLQIGEPDVYRDSPYQTWTSGIQYYTIYTGRNPKQDIPSVIYPPLLRPELWAEPSVGFEQVNRRNTQDITDMAMEPLYSCKSCDIASASLGTPVQYQPRNPTAPLPVAAYPGEFPVTGRFTDALIGNNILDWPQPQNPILTLQARKRGIPTPPIPKDYDDHMLKQLKHGFAII